MDNSIGARSFKAKTRGAGGCGAASAEGPRGVAEKKLTRMGCTAEVVPISLVPPLFSAPLIGLLRPHGRRNIQPGDLDCVLCRRMTVPQRCYWYQSIIMVSSPLSVRRRPPISVA